jgi:Virulence factor membrane-bound polymerase, C-terminal/O-Antigen ligase/Protein glycosylation ligase
MLCTRVFYAGLTLYVLAWIGYDHYRPWINFHLESLAFAAISLLTVGLLVRTERIVAPLAMVSVCGAATVYVWLQYWSGLVPFSGDAFVSSIFLIGFFVAITVGFTLASQPTDSENWLIPLMHAVWISAFLSALIGLLQWLNLHHAWGMYLVQTDLGDRAAGNLGQPNELATLLLMGLAALYYVYSERHMGKIASIAITLVITIAFVLTQSRAGLVSALLMVGFVCWKSTLPLSKLSAKWAVTWFACVLIATWALPFLSKLLLLDITRNMSANGSELRVYMWKQMVAGIAQSPWVGYGWNHTPTALSAGAVMYPGEHTYSYAHNIILDILAWCGFPVGLLLTGLCSYWVLSRAVWVTTHTALCAMAGLIPILMHSMVEFPFASAYFLLSAGILAGIVEYAAPKTKVLTMRKFPMWIALALWTPLTGYLVYEYLLIEEDFRVVRFQSMSIGAVPSGYEAPKVILLTQLGNILTAGRIKPKPAMESGDIELLRKVSKRYLFGTMNNRYALSLALNGQIDKARYELTVIKALYGPHYYKALMYELEELQRTKYPVLAPLLEK